MNSIKMRVSLSKPILIFYIFILSFIIISYWQLIFMTDDVSKHTEKQNYKLCLYSHTLFNFYTRSSTDKLLTNC